ncbi:hypothetical protein Egran_00251 [Elaphomyces granulatus]|uniref:RRM domain-containing protein n=1 Tax=Elaphomyces granulatus TaxID=519963 RepID=A0A232M796_9EURO|nr:hypothetical protein Egran_00251 [Elaphomyces granulatus]
MKFTVPQHQPPASLGQNLASPTIPPMNPHYRGGQVTQAPIPSFPAMHGMMPGRQMNIPVTQQILPPALPPNVVTPERVVDPNMIPITSLAQYRGPPQWGVIKVSNIPYNVTKPEITQFMGRGAHILTPDIGNAVHIIMERSTAKTMECYVEFLTVADALATFSRLNHFQEGGRYPRIGNRHVIIEMSSQDALLKDMFPRAKCVIWESGLPRVTPNTDSYSTGFQGFLTSEELLGVIRHAENPHRSPFATKSPQRTYECTISTLDKFPWYATALYTVQDRNVIFKSVNRQVTALVGKIRKTKTVGLDQKLLKDLLQAAYRCPAFNDRQKFTLALNSQDQNEISKFPDVARYWPFDTLVMRPNTPMTVLLHYAYLISKGADVVDFGNEEDLVNRNRDHPLLEHSPYGRLLLEWEADKLNYKWKDAFNHEMDIATRLVTEGFHTSMTETPHNQPLVAVRPDMATPNSISTATPTPTQPNHFIASHPPSSHYYHSESPELHYPVGHRNTYGLPAGFFNGYGIAYNYCHPMMASPGPLIHPPVPSGPFGLTHQQPLLNGRGLVQGLPPAYMG